MLPCQSQEAPCGVKCLCLRFIETILASFMATEKNNTASSLRQKPLFVYCSMYYNDEYNNIYFVTIEALEYLITKASFFLSAHIQPCSSRHGPV